MSQHHIMTIEHMTRLYDEKEVLSDIWLAFYPGAKIGVLGSNGSGKSTFADLVMGLLESDTGDLRIDDILLKGANRRGWRENTGRSTG